MPTAFAIALAVMGWSPVTMITLMPAERHFSTASGTLERGGSMREMRPTKQRSSRGKFTWEERGQGLCGVCGVCVCVNVVHVRVWCACGVCVHVVCAHSM